MAIKVVIEFQAMPGERAHLKGLLENISAAHGPDAPGFPVSTVYEALDSADGLVEIANWESAEAQAVAMEQATVAGIYPPVVEFVAAPFKVIPIDWLAVLTTARLRRGHFKGGHHGSDGDGGTNRAGQGRRLGAEFAGQLGGARKAEFADFNSRHRITDHRAWLQKNPDGSSVVIVVIDGPGAESLMGGSRDLRQ